MISITAKNFTLTEADEAKVRAKAEKLLRLSKDMSDESTRIVINFEVLAKQKNLILGTATVTMPQDTLRAEASEEKNIISIMDQLEAELRPQIEKHKSKHKETLI